MGPTSETSEPTLRTKAILIIGGSGFVGTHLALGLREGYKVFATYHNHPVRIRGVTFIPFSVENRNWVKRVIYTAQPDVIVYAAGSNNLAWCEDHPRETEQAHTGGPATCSNVSGIFQTKFIYLSNCYTFDGTRGNYHEADTVLPNTGLGKAKVGGENFIRGKSLNYAILRSSPLFGRGNGVARSFLDLVRMRLSRGERVEAPRNEAHSFAPVEGLVDVLVRLIETGLRNKTYHYGGLTKLTHYDFARQFARRFGYDGSLVVPERDPIKKSGHHHAGELEDYSLNCTQLTENLKIKPLLLEEGFDLIQKKLIPGA